MMLQRATQRDLGANLTRPAGRNWRDAVLASGTALAFAFVIACIFILR